MSRYILVITKNTELASRISTKKEALIPQGHRDESDILHVVNANEADYVSNLLEVKIKQSNKKYIIIICDESLKFKYEKYLSVYFFCFAPICDFKKPIENKVRGVVGRALKVFSHLEKCAQKSEKLQALLLPLENFQSNNLSAIRSMLCNVFLFNERNFKQELEGEISLLLRARKPKVKTRNNLRYFVDGSRMFYHYGYEIHAMNESVGGNHNLLCELSATFRFGLRFDERRHFNVSREGSKNVWFDGFVNCHGDVSSVSRTATHLNMFPNCYFVEKF